MATARRAGSGHVRRTFGAALVGLVTVVACREPIAPAVPAPSIMPVASACARVVSCSHAHDPPRLQNPSVCVDWWVSHGSDPEGDVACLTAATDCAGVERCLHGAGDARAAAYCAAHPGTLTACDGSDRIACGDDDVAESTRTDCAAIGATCAQVSAGGGLVSSACVSQKLCPPEVTRARCDGPGAVLSCRDGAVERVPCTDGTHCLEHAHGDGTEFAMCEGDGHVACDAVGTRCEGDRLVACEAHGHYSHSRETDCAAVGLTCSKGSAGAACVARAAQCASGPARCEGDALAFCAAGRPVKVSCPRLGFGSCDPDARGLEAGCAGMPRNIEAFGVAKEHALR